MVPTLSADLATLHRKVESQLSMRQVLLAENRSRNSPSLSSIFAYLAQHRRISVCVSDDFIMLRLPLTSISISKADLDCHLHDIDKYQSLVQQGFSKNDVLQYFQQQQRAISDGFRSSGELDDLVDSVGMADRWLKSEDKSKSFGVEQPSKSETSPSSTAALNSKPQNQQMVESYVALQKDQRERGVRDLNTASPSQAILGEVNLDPGEKRIIHPRHASHQYAPRHSSLLRLTDLVTSDEELAEVQQQPTSPSIRTVICISSRDSRRSDEDLNTDDDLDFNDTMEKLGKLAVEENDGEENLQRNDMDTASDSFLHKSDSPTYLSKISSSLPSTPKALVVAARVIETPSRSHASPTAPADSIPSSPPMVNANTTDFEIGEAYLTDSQGDRSHPSALTRRSSFEILQQSSGSMNETTPSTVGRSNTRDGRSFMVYNDRHSRATQPQTPADLQRTTLSEYNASYTAPPGMISYGSQIHVCDRNLYSYERSDISPTVRAIDLRNRRNREFRRSATVESLRLSRTPRRPQINDLDGNHIEHIEMWRDDLDADRVGEENFDLSPNIFRVLGFDGVRRFSNTQTEF